MIKKIIAGLLVIGIVILACFKLFSHNEVNAKKLEKMGESLTSYHMEANMEIEQNDNLRKYYVVVDYLKGDVDYFKISLLDKDISQEQIMIRNKEGVYVLTPKLNQVYEFKGDYPLNSPKPYLYHSMVNEIKKKNYEAKKVSDGYLITSNVEYKNNPSWAKQEIKLSSDLKPVWVNIYDKDNDLIVAINYTKVDFSPELKVSYFDVKETMDKSRETISQSGTIKELPSLPHVDSVSSILKETTEASINGEKVYILTYEGNKNFTLVQKSIEANKDMNVKVVSGELITFYTGLGYFENNKLTYIEDNMEYQIYSSSLSVNEMIDVIDSLDYEDTK